VIYPSYKFAISSAPPLFCTLCIEPLPNFQTTIGALKPESLNYSVVKTAWTYVTVCWNYNTVW